MRKISNNFLKRIKDRALEKAKERIRQELSPETPEEKKQRERDVYEGIERDLPRGFLDRLKESVKERVQEIPSVEELYLDPDATLDLPTLNYRLRFAGQNRLLVLLEYVGHSSRLVEPYSYRTGTGKHAGTVYFFGWCRLHNRIHKFNRDKITGCTVTEIPFVPRYEIEF